MKDTTPNTNTAITTTATLIINEQHTLLDEQKDIMTQKFGTWKTILVPKNGWNREKQHAVRMELKGQVVFASPIPGLVKLLSRDSAINWVGNRISSEYPFSPYGENREVTEVWVFSNDTRQKKELPGGKIISILAQTGWYLE